MHIKLFQKLSFNESVVPAVMQCYTQGAETVKEELIDDIVKESAPYQPPGNEYVII